MMINGKCDRIDLNLNTGKWRIFDYKTSSKAKKPVKKLAVTDLERLKAGVMSTSFEVSSELTDGTKTEKVTNQKTGTAATATRSTTPSTS